MDNLIRFFLIQESIMITNGMVTIGINKEIFQGLFLVELVILDFHGLILIGIQKIVLIK